jgi:hypothetical protein
MTKVLVASVLALILGAFIIEGCGTSNAGNGTYNTAGLVGYTSCTTANIGTPQTCIPNLGTYGTNVVYQGYANITNTGQAKGFIRSFPQFSSDSIVNSSLTAASITISLASTGNGPSLNLSISWPGAQDNSDPMLAGYPFTGYTTFLVNSKSSNPNVGAIQMQGASFNASSVTVTSTQPWDGSIPYMTAATVLLNGQSAGSVGLQRVQ